MAHAQSPPDDAPLVLKTTSMFRVFQEVDALLEEAYALIGKRPATSPRAEPHEDEKESADEPFARLSPRSRDAPGLDEELMRQENETNSPRKASKATRLKNNENSDSYDTAGSELDENGNVKLRRKSKSKASTRRKASASPASRVRIHTAKGNMYIGDATNDETPSRYNKSSTTKSPSRPVGGTGGDADSAVDKNNNDVNIILNPERARLFSTND